MVNSVAQPSRPPIYREVPTSPPTTSSGHEDIELLERGGTPQPAATASGPTSPGTVRDFLNRNLPSVRSILTHTGAALVGAGVAYAATRASQTAGADGNALGPVHNGLTHGPTRWNGPTTMMAPDLPHDPAAGASSTLPGFTTAPSPSLPAFTRSARIHTDVNAIEANACKGRASPFNGSAELSNGQRARIGLQIEALRKNVIERSGSPLDLAQSQSLQLACEELATQFSVCRNAGSGPSPQTGFETFLHAVGRAYFPDRSSSHWPAAQMPAVEQDAYVLYSMAALIARRKDLTIVGPAIRDIKAHEAPFDPNDPYETLSDLDLDVIRDAVANGYLPSLIRRRAQGQPDPHPAFANCTPSWRVAEQENFARDVPSTISKTQPGDAEFLHTDEARVWLRETGAWVIDEVVQALAIDAQPQADTPADSPACAPATVPPVTTAANAGPQAPEA